jgi:OmpA-OmpF porin, OOP family
MRKTIIGLLCATAVIASPATARDGAVYVGGEFGPMWANDTEIDVNGVEDVVSIDYEAEMPWDDIGGTGWDGGVFLGYDFGGFRIEGEASMKKARIEQYTSSVAFPGGAPPGTRAAVGHTDVMSFMLNGMADFGDDDGISAFVGAGVGYAKVDLDGFGAFSNQPAFLDDSDGGLAWQLFAGVRQAISDTVDVHLKYRYFNTSGVDLTTGVNAGETNFSSHSVLGGLTFNFGGAPEPPPPPAPAPRAAPPPPAPPPPAMRECPGNVRVPANQACPVPPAPPVPRTGERG